MSYFLLTPSIKNLNFKPSNGSFQKLTAPSGIPPFIKSSFIFWNSMWRPVSLLPGLPWSQHMHRKLDKLVERIGHDSAMNIHVSSRFCSVLAGRNPYNFIEFPKFCCLKPTLLVGFLLWISSLKKRVFPRWNSWKTASPPFGSEGWPLAVWPFRRLGRPFCNFKVPRKATFWKPCNTFRRHPWSWNVVVFFVG